MADASIDRYNEIWKILSPNEKVVFALALNNKKARGEKTPLILNRIFENVSTDSPELITR